MVPPDSTGFGSIVVITEINGSSMTWIVIVPTIPHPESLSALASTVASPVVSDCSVTVACPCSLVVTVVVERLPSVVLKLTVRFHSTCPHLSTTVAVITDSLTPGMPIPDIRVASAVTMIRAGSSA